MGTIRARTIMNPYKRFLDPIDLFRHVSSFCSDFAIRVFWILLNNCYLMTMRCLAKIPALRVFLKKMSWVTFTAQKIYNQVGNTCVILPLSDAVEIPEKDFYSPLN